jgi:hypothetical protein
MTSLSHISWENFRATVFIRGEQRVHRVIASPTIEMFGDGSANRIGIWLEIPSVTAIPPEISGLAVVTSRKIEKKSKSYLEIATTATSLHRQFYHFMVAVTERIVVEKRSAIDAVAIELQCFAELLQQRPILSMIGLLGELLFLHRLMPMHGFEALDAWVGPIGEPHDFRIRDREFEIKSTVAPRRTHTIHGVEQLVPSKDCSLAVISVLLGPPGANDGFSLPSMANTILDALGSSCERILQFNSALEVCGFRLGDIAHYQRRYILRRSMGLIPVNDTFPAITRITIQKALGPLAPRIDAVQYEVDVEGLEREEEHSEFESALQP